MASKPIWQSYVFHGDACFFVSTIERDYDIAAAPGMRGLETLVWQYDYEKRERGELIGQSGGIADHIQVCHSLIQSGKLPSGYEQEAR
jgi:hypothetical protein